MLFSRKNSAQWWKAFDLLLLVVALAVSWWGYRVITEYYQKSQSQFQQWVAEKSQTPPEQCQNCKHKDLDGRLVEPDYQYYPVAVIIENHTDARPQAGLTQASVVFEAEAEGGITRFLAVFDSNLLPDKIGPVRSARPYFLDWAKEFSALLVHVGGSPEALVRIIKENILSLNEFYNGDYFWRASERSAPHNVYTSKNRLIKYLEKRQLGTAKFLPWEFKSDAPFAERPTSTVVKINFFLPAYRVKWIYDHQANDFVRYVGGVVQRDEGGQEIRAKNLAIAQTKAEVIDEELRLKMGNIGDGKAIVCFDGRCQDALWVKRAPTSRLRFYDSTDKEIKFNAGVTWIEIVKPEVGIEYRH